MSDGSGTVSPEAGAPAEDSPGADTLLWADGVTKEFGGLVAVNNVSFVIEPLTIVSIIGPNGAGKTTFFNMLTGLYRPSGGQIIFDGRNVTRTRPDIITGHGVARTFQNIRLFGAMTRARERHDRPPLAHPRRPVRLDSPHPARAAGGAADP